MPNRPLPILEMSPDIATRGGRDPKPTGLVNWQTATGAGDFILPEASFCAVPTGHPSPRAEFNRALDNMVQRRSFRAERHAQL